MPPKRVQKDPSADPASWREDQRRLRNRLSQKAVRERKAARIQQLEQQLATVTKGGDSARINELLDTNSRLRIALLDTRKKLASLSATATQLGERIKLVLDDNENEETQSCENDAGPQETDMLDDQAYDLWKDAPDTDTQSPLTSSTTSISVRHDAEQYPNTELDMIDSNSNMHRETTYAEDISTHSQRVLDPMESLFEASKMGFAMTNLFPGPRLQPKLHVYHGSVLSQHLDHIHGLVRLGSGLEQGSRSAIQRSIFTLLDELEPLIPCSIPQIIDNMFAAFLEHGWPSVKYWFNVTQSLSRARRLLWWQSIHSHEAATQVPPGNTPTLIQLSRPRYPSILDWVPHPGLRDILILNYESYDVDQVICDMTDSFVVEVEGAIPRLEPSDFDQPTTGKGYGYNLMDLVEKTLVFGPLDSQSQQQFTVLKLLREISTVKFSSSWEHPIHRFKLDPRFFEKYPALYDAHAESRYRPRSPPTSMQKSQLPLPFTTESVQAYMAAALEARGSTIST